MVLSGSLLLRAAVDIPTIERQAPPMPKQERQERPRHEFDERQPTSNNSTILLEGGDDSEEEGEEFDEENEPNFNLADGAVPQGVGPGGVAAVGGRPPQGGPGGPNSNRRRRRRGRPGPGGGRGPSSGN